VPSAIRQSQYLAAAHERHHVWLDSHVGAGQNTQGT
jgi:hypothetical protein